MNYPKNIIADEGKRAIIYLRVSTEEQVDNFSLGTQEEICRKEAEKRGYEIVEVFKEEGKSAKTIIGRPILISLLEYARRNKKRIQAVFVYRIDRISRQTSDYLAIRKKLTESGVTIISASEPTGDSPTEKLVETILAGFAQLDNDIRSERTRNGMRARFLAGFINSRPALGYKLEAGYAVKDAETWDKVKDAWDLMATGTKSLSEIAHIMNAWGLRKVANGKEYQLRSQTTNRIFRQKFYMGILTSEAYPEEVKGLHVPMITEQQFYKVQAILDGRNVNKMPLTQRDHKSDEFPLRRIIKCGMCGIGLTGGFSRGRSAKYPYYRCSSKSCNTISVKKDDLEDGVVSLLKTVTPKEECLKLFMMFMYKAFHERLTRVNSIKNEADDEIRKLQDTRKLLIEKNLSGVYSDEIFREQNSLLEDKIVQAQIAKDDSILEKYNIDAVISFTKTLLADLGETYRRSNTNQVKVLLGSIFPSGLAWNYNGTLNHRISPIYQAVLQFDNQAIPLGDPTGARTRNQKLKRLLLYH